MYTSTKGTPMKTKTPANVIEAARKMLDLETMETRNRDSLDFHNLSVESIRRVIEMAYEAGRKSK